MLNVGSIMTRDLVTVDPAESLELARRRMSERGVRHLPVVERGELVGMLSERDLDGGLAARPPSAPGAGPSVRERMTAVVETAEWDDSLLSCCRRLDQSRVGGLPILHGGRLAGVLSETDLLHVHARLCAQLGHDDRIDPRIATCMTRAVVVVDPETRVADAVERLRSAAVRHLPVLHQGWFVGIVSDHDLYPFLGGGEELRRRVGELMTRDRLILAEPDERLSDATTAMLRGHIHCVPVVVDGRLLGIVTSADVLGVLGRLDESLVASAWESAVALDAARVEE